MDSPIVERAEVLVVGGGAAGLMAAWQAARIGARTVLLEKNRKPGLKILISGGGRCNLTTTRSGRDLENQYGVRRGRWLRHALRAFPPQKLIDLVEDQGVALREEDLDKIFPVSGRAADVLDAVVRGAEAAGALLAREAPVTALRRDGDGFLAVTPRGRIHAPRVVLATGGLSYPKTGATGDGYGFAQALGHGLVEPVPHLAPLPVDDAWVRSLSGIVLADSSIAVGPVGGAEDCRRHRPILFTHKGLSGPAPMDLAGFIEERHGGCDLRLDFVPEARLDELEAEWLCEAATQGRRLAAALLPSRLPERLRQTLAALAGVEATTAAEVTKAARKDLLRRLKDTRIAVERSLGFGHAEVTRGGVPLDEVDPKTMESKVAPGLFLCGELIDVDGPIGGFNFQAAFATGRLAGIHAGAT